MNGLEGTSVGPNLLALLETKQDAGIENKITELEGMARAIVPALEAANKKLQECEAHTAEYRRLGVALNAEIAKETEAFSKFRNACIQERFDNFDATDVNGLAQQLRTRSDALRLNLSAYSWLMEIGIQDAVEAKLEAHLKASGVKTTQVTILTVLSEARTNRALGDAFREEGTLGVVGGRTSAMQIALKQAMKDEQTAREALADFRARRAKLEQQKRAAGYITSAQAPNTF